MKELTIRVSDMLHRIGIPANLSGYKCLREAIILRLTDPMSVSTLTKTLYPAVAKKYGTTASRVERAIRHAIEVAWNRGDLAILQKYFGYTVSNAKGKPTNGEFIAMVVEWFELGRDD